MTSTQVQEFKSKEACPRCEEHKLFTNDTQKGLPYVRYRCLSCNHEFSKKAEDKAKKKKKATSKSESYFGLLLVAVTMFVIVVITMADQNQQNQEGLAPASRIELLRRWVG